MKSKSVFIAASIIFVFLSLVYYNYYNAQLAIKDTKPSPLFVSLVSSPETVSASNSARFAWKIVASPDLSTSFTTIYWGYDSSPSALTKQDSPQAVGYPYSSPDYTSGLFSLPDTFELDIPFTHPGKVFFRAYAKVRDDYLWSEERTLTVTK